MHIVAANMCVWMKYLIKETLDELAEEAEANRQDNLDERFHRASSQAFDGGIIIFTRNRLPCWKSQSNNK